MGQNWVSNRRNVAFVIVDIVIVVVVDIDIVVVVDLQNLPLKFG